MEFLQIHCQQRIREGDVCRPERKRLGVKQVVLENTRPWESAQWSVQGPLDIWPPGKTHSPFPSNTLLHIQTVAHSCGSCPVQQQFSNVYGFLCGFILFTPCSKVVIQYFIWNHLARSQSQVSSSAESDLTFDSQTIIVFSLAAPPTQAHVPWSDSNYVAKTDVFITVSLSYFGHQQHCCGSNKVVDLAKYTQTEFLKNTPFITHYCVVV